jgi:hypothetical protein
MSHTERIAAAMMLFSLAAPMRGQFFGDYNHPEFTVQHASGWSDQNRLGECEIRVTVDNQVNVELRWDRLRLATVAGTAGRDRGSICNAPLQQSGVTNVQFQRIEGRGQMNLIESPNANNGWAAIVRIVDRNGGEGNYAYRLSWQWDGTRPQTSQDDQSWRRGGARGRNVGSAQRSCRQALASRLKSEWGALVENYDNGSRGQVDANAAITGRANIRAGNDRRQIDYQCYVNPNSNQVEQVYYDFVGDRFPWNPQPLGSETPPPGADTSYDIISGCQEVIRKRATEQLGASRVSFRDISRKWWEGNVQRVNGRASANVSGRTVTLDYNCTARRGNIEWGDFRVLDGSQAN